MKIKALLLFSIFFFACGQKEKNQVDLIMENMMQRLNATGYNVVELDSNTGKVGMGNMLKIDVNGCKGIDLMDKEWNGVLQEYAQKLKDNIKGSERIEKYEFTLMKDPNDTAPSKIGLNVNAKGFTVMRENLQ